MARVELLALRGLDEAQALRLLPPERREKALRCRRQEDRLRSAAAGLLLARYARQLGFDRFPALREDVYGKPYFPDASQAQFSLSHSGGYAALAMSSLPVGVDIQEIRPERVPAAMRFLTDFEQAQLAALPPAEQVQAFFRLWTVKESYGKMTGRGLLGADTFSVDLSGPAVLPPDGRQFCLHAPEGYCLSVSTRDGECEGPVLLHWADLQSALSDDLALCVGADDPVRP